MTDVLSRLTRAAAAMGILLTVASLCAAELKRIEIDDRREVAGGHPFGLAGSYEKLSGRFFFELDPTLAPNRVITDIDYAETNVTGHVELSAEFYLIKPKDITRGNGSLLLEVGNRGGKGLLPFFNFAERSTDPETMSHFGDGFLMRRGMTLLWVGWQWDTPEVEGRMRMFPPVATNGGKTIQGLVRSDFVPKGGELFHSLADRNHIAYPVADENAPENVMTVRDDVESERRVVPRERWRFSRVEDGAVLSDPRYVYLDGGFERFKIYEVVYLSEAPPLVGAGAAAIRDAISALKYSGAELLDIPSGVIDRAVGFGISQSGRFLRTFLYYGFNEDESGRRVFDGVMAHVAGGGRGSFNHRFAQASRDAHPYINFFHPTDIFPFTDRAQLDHDTGLKDGLLSRHRPDLLPRVFYTNSSYEYWGRAASLIHTTIDGAEDVKMLDDVRVYQFSGTQHGPAGFPPRRTLGQHKSNPMDFRWSMRALLAAMVGWSSDAERLPPESRYGRLEDGSLVSPEALRFPEIPGVERNPRIHKAYRADYGEQFRTEGIVSVEPPLIGDAFPMRVPAVDADGNELSGISMPEHRVPLATYTGWNFFNDASGPAHILSSMQGMYLPFPRTRDERSRTGDPRRAIEERYHNREHYLGLVASAALELIDEGYLLGEDLPQILENAREHWDTLMAP